jgi:hypothetical protein
MSSIEASYTGTLRFNKIMLFSWALTSKKMPKISPYFIIYLLLAIHLQQKQSTPSN